MALRRLSLCLAQTVRPYQALCTAMKSTRKPVTNPVLYDSPHYTQLIINRLKTTEPDSSDDAKANIVASISQNTSNVRVNSLLYHRTAFDRVLDLMLDLRFKEKDIVDLFVSAPQLLHSESAMLEATFRILRGEGFSVRQTILVLKENPNITASLENVGDVIQFFRDVIVLPDGNLQDVLTMNQALFFVSSNVLRDNHKILMSIFRRSDITRMLYRNPLILLQRNEEVMAKVNYVHCQMGLEQIDMVWASILSHSLQHIHMRHQCMLRTGCFEKPDKKGATHKPNPYLKDMLGASDFEFCKMAGITMEEFEVFGQLLEVEKAQILEEFQEQLDDEDQDDDGESGYVKERVIKERMKKKTIY